MSNYAQVCSFTYSYLYANNIKFNITLPYTFKSYEISFPFTISKQFYRAILLQTRTIGKISIFSAFVITTSEMPRSDTGCPQLTTLYYRLLLWRISSPLFFGVNLSENGSRNYSFHTHCQKSTLLWMQYRCTEQVTTVNNDTASYLQSGGIIF